jgi:hypothetical protein
LGINCGHGSVVAAGARKIGNRRTLFYFGIPQTRYLAAAFDIPKPVKTCSYFLILISPQILHFIIKNHFNMC